MLEDVDRDVAATDTVARPSAREPTNLLVQSIVVVDQDRNVYANDCYADGVDFFYVPVEITVKNNGADAAGARAKQTW
jgi:hypothetical protein